MTKAQKAKFILQYLEELYPSVEIPLRFTNPFTFLIAVLLSAQCTDKRVNEVTPKLFKLADNPQKMLALGVDKVREIIRPCGLSNNKSKNIIALSKILLDKYSGEVPRDMKALESLPGVGHKTASVIMMQAFGVPTFPVDTHIHRLATRWGLTNGKSVEQTEKDLKKLFPKESWNKLHLQLILYGREHCGAHLCKTPDKMCHICRALRLPKSKEN